MTKQCEALRLADALDAHQFDEPHAAAAELRRLKNQRDQLLEALKDLMQQYKDQPECFMDWSKARAAIRTVAVEE